MKTRVRRLAVILPTVAFTFVGLTGVANAATVTVDTDTIKTTVSDRRCTISGYPYGSSYGFKIVTTYGRTRNVRMTNRRTGVVQLNIDIPAHTTKLRCWLPRSLNGTDDFTVRVQEYVPFLPDPVGTRILYRG